MPESKAVLFFTHSELGQASVALAVAHELAHSPGTAVHISSFPSLKPHIDALNHDFGTHIAWHALEGQSMKEALASQGLNFLPRHARGVQGAVGAYRECLPFVLAPWEPAGYEKVLRSCEGVIQKVDPDVVVLDPLFGPGADACTALRRHYVFLSPGTFKDHAVQEQPYMSIFWKYSVLGSGFEFPVPLSLIPANIYLAFSALFRAFLSDRVTTLTKWRNSNGITGDLSTIFSNFNHRIDHLVQSKPELDYPMTVPANIKGCGPIIPPFNPVSQEPEIEDWLSRQPTILFNLGSHGSYTAREARQVVQALEHVLSQHPDVQILWKYRPAAVEAEEACDVLDGVPPEIKSRIHITSWILPSPTAVLVHSSTILYIHHGGSNAFHEAVAAGVPQVVCPVWLDTYDFATRVEMLGIGVRGNREAAPYLETGELAAAVCEALGSARHEINAHAESLSRQVVGDVSDNDICAVGRKKAARIILDHMC